LSPDSKKAGELFEEILNGIKVSPQAINLQDGNDEQ